MERSGAQVVFWAPRPLPLVNKLLWDGVGRWSISPNGSLISVRIMIFPILGRDLSSFAGHFAHFTVL